MNTLYCHGNYTARGGTLWPIVRLLSHFHGVVAKTYEGERHGTYLGHNVLDDKHVASSMRRVIFVGGARPNDDGIPRAWRWNRADHVVFISEFFRQIARSRYDIQKSSVIHLVGGVPNDFDLSPVSPYTKSFAQDDEINFMICAKWHKRYFKRYPQHVNFFLHYILKKYPNAKLHVLGKRMDVDQTGDDHITSYRLDFYSDIQAEVFRKCDIQLVFTPFDTGPMTVNESMHYRLPFICGNNSAAQEFIDMVDGKCGMVVDIDPQIRNFKDCRKYKPMTNKKFYGKEVDYEMLIDNVVHMIDNYSDYTTWNWTDDFNYKTQADKWMNILFG